MPVSLPELTGVVAAIDVALMPCFYSRKFISKRLFEANNYLLHY